MNGPRPQIDAPVHDARIAASIEHRIESFDESLARALEVVVHDGVVELRGRAPHLAALRLAHQVASRTRGVRAVIVRATIEPAPLSDEAIESAVERALRLHPATNELAIRVGSRDARVTLAGVVSSITEQQLVESIASGVRGVRAIANTVEVEPRIDPSDAELEADVEARLARDVRLDGWRLDATVRDGRVALEGVVGHDDERTAALWIARVAGARAVDGSRVRVDDDVADGLRRVGVERIATADAATAVRDAIMLDDRVRVDDIAVRVAAGIATLSGTVPTVAAERAALEDALHTIGVWRVEDELRVEPRVDATAASLRARIFALLDTNPWLDGSDVAVDVETDGVATLLGSASSPFARSEAERLVSYVEGVTAIDNRISALRQGRAISDEALEAEIRTALFWNPWVDAGAISVEANRGAVTLRGEVRDGRALREAEREAHEAGALSVLNALELDEPPAFAPRVISPQPDGDRPR